MRTKAKIEQHRTTEDAAYKDLPDPLQKPQPPEGEAEGSESEEVLMRKKAINIRKPISSKERINLSIFEAEEKKVNTAKIINFSFCSQSPRRERESPDRRGNIPAATKLNFI